MRDFTHLFLAILKNGLITAKDHASVQLNVGHLDEAGRYTGQFSTFALCGYIRAQVPLLAFLKGRHFMILEDPRSVFLFVELVQPILLFTSGRLPWRKRPWNTLSDYSFNSNFWRAKRFKDVCCYAGNGQAAAILVLSRLWVITCIALFQGGLPSLARCQRYYACDLLLFCCITALLAEFEVLFWKNPPMQGPFRWFLVV
ncbi:hypothetical protein RHMOL_Rhmol05G0098700 [Rhododendron molle]|uniref:Uncharacterized protein n=1 Tax=Rhododendron molle TaxID=49168 RepID=A0ACC0NMC1_RHOML|nr:hypothetical protein RHMOL_Rhmol05G0098700 [Rhododendron molle]